MNFAQDIITIVKFDPKSQKTISEQGYGYVAINDDGQNVGLAYHLMIDSQGDEAYVTTHLASGYEMGIKFRSEDDVRAYIEAIASLLDWPNQTAKSIFETSAEFKAKMKQAAVHVIEGDKSRLCIEGNKKWRKQMLEKSREIAGA